jgi:transposase, IS30 family
MPVRDGPPHRHHGRPRHPGLFSATRTRWQHGSNENANGLLRQYFPKGTDLTVHGPEHLRAVEDEINRCPRMVLADRAPTDVFAAC